MPGLNVKAKPIINRNTAYPADVSTAVSQLEKTGGTVATSTASALRNIQAALNDIQRTLRTVPPEVTQVAVTDGTGKVVGFVGDFEFAGVVTRNYFSEIHIGDPLGTGDPTQAVINVNSDGQITVGSTGWIDVVDPYAGHAAWIGTQFDTLAITGAANNGSGLIRLTVVGHAFLTGDAAIIQYVGGVPNATGQFTLTKIDATHVDLQASVWDGTYTSGGTITRLLHVTGAVNNGSGLIRLTVTAHGYESGDVVNVASVGGVAAATGQWIITVITANTFDLVGSTFAGTYTTGGVCIRYFAGGLFQTIAVGPSFAGYKLRAFKNGTLKIKDAQITLAGTGATIDLNPTTGQITVTETSPGTRRVTIDGNGVTVDVTSGTAYFSRLSETALTLKLDDTNLYQIVANSGSGISVDAPTGTFANSKLFDVRGYAGSTVYGPLVALQQFRGTGASPTASQAGDTLGGLVAYGSDRTVDAYYGGLRVVATEAAGVGAHGAKIVFETVANGGTTLVENMTLDNDGTLNVVGGYKANGAAGLSSTRNLGTSVSYGTEATAVKGTPGIGQANFTAVTSVTLNLTATTFTKGLLTA